MNFRIFMDEKKFTKLFIILAATLFTAGSFAEWKIDLSRRAKHIGVQKYIEVIPKEEKKEVFKYYHSNKHPIQELVIMQTAKGFVPESVSLRAGVQYRVYLVNVDKSVKNSSFILPKFSQYHSMYFGNAKSFIIHPQEEGVFKFESPETQNIGKIIVHTNPKEMSMQGLSKKLDHLDLTRGLASEGK